MSSSVTVSIGTNTAIAVAKGFGFLVTGSPTLFAETVHSLADVGNQVLLKIGEVRSRGGPDELHPFGPAQEKYFWALVSAVSVFFVGCGVNIYHGVHALFAPEAVEPFTPLVLGLLLFALALESWTFAIAFREIGGMAGLRDNRHNTPVLAVVLEDAVALTGIGLTLLVGGSSLVWGPHAAFDAGVAIVVGVMLGLMAIFLAAINRRVLIDTSDPALDRDLERWLGAQGIDARVRSLVLDDGRVTLFVRATHEVAGSCEVGEALGRHAADACETRVDTVYWQFRSAPADAGR